VDMRDFITGLPKAELHMHLEGSLEPELMMRLAKKNRIDIPYATVEEIRAAYEFTQLQDFLDIYYQGMSVLRTEEDFHDLAFAYAKRTAADGAVHVEVFFDPQAHTARGLPFSVAADGILSGLADAERQFGMTSQVILCFLRHLDETDALRTFSEAEPWLADGRIVGIGLDSSEVGFPPENFQKVFAAARDAGLRLVAHAGEEGPPDYVRQAIDLLHIHRIDHGNRAMEDAELVHRLAAMKIGLTVCPLSNLKLCGVTDMRRHPLKAMLDAGLKATINSDDPAYFGGYLMDNYMAVVDALDLSIADVVTLARNSIEVSFLDEDSKARHLRAISEAAEEVRH